jgi:hypothetical protein
MVVVEGDSAGGDAHVMAVVVTSATSGVMTTASNLHRTFSGSRTAEVKSPSTTTCVPPVVGPCSGDTDVREGGGEYVKAGAQSGE